MELARGITLIAATFTTGLVAGLFYAFAQAVMPGLGRSDDRVFVAAFRAIDGAIDNGWQAVGFVGAPVFTVLAAALQLGAEDRSSLAWIVAALVPYGAMLAITFRVHVPLNSAIQAAGAPEDIADLAAVRPRSAASSGRSCGSGPAEVIRRRRRRSARSAARKCGRSRTPAAGSGRRERDDRTVGGERLDHDQHGPHPQHRDQYRHGGCARRRSAARPSILERP